MDSFFFSNYRTILAQSDSYFCRRPGQGKGMSPAPAELFSPSELASRGPNSNPKVAPFLLGIA
jgi:hypothetical protein